MIAVRRRQTRRTFAADAGGPDPVQEVIDALEAAGPDPIGVNGVAAALGVDQTPGQQAGRRGGLGRPGTT